MSGGGGKGGKQTQSVEIDPEMKEVALRTMKRAEEASNLPYQPNQGLQLVDFTPQQKAAMAGANTAAEAFGLRTAPAANMPVAKTVDGVSGFDTNALRKDAMGKTYSTKFQQTLNSLFGNPELMQPNTKPAGTNPFTTAATNAVEAVKSVLPTRLSDTEIGYDPETMDPISRKWLEQAYREKNG